VRRPGLANEGFHPHTVDIVGRYGGEKSAVIYPEIKLSSAIDAARRLQHNAGISDLCLQNLTLDVPFSAGIVSLQDHETCTLDQLIERADKSMYMAKQKRNCLA
jgi:diguanylate cyclase (GGDEF)-like protein